MTDKIFADQVAVVTGASRGIGQAIALELAGQGAHVVLTGRTQGGLEATEEKIHVGGGSATIAPLDITQGAHVDQLASAVVQRWGRLDILVLSAATLGSLMPLAHIEPDDFEAVIATNLTANFRLLRAFDLALRRSARGKVIALTSSVAQNPRAYWSAYAASKAALENLIASYADEVCNISPIKCLIIDPQRTRTKMRSAAFPGEDPMSLPTAHEKALRIVAAIAKANLACERIILE
jgi:NAD(P)-dependent dehydrogenase (short-subunit alcohol dehydrogenase family)